jgi:TonB family protein
VSGRTSGMISQMQHHRAERKKPKRFVALKKISLDPRQQHSISAAQANLPKHPITKKNVERSSVALTFAMAFHILFALIVGIFLMAERIEFEDEKFDVSMVTEKEKPPRPPIVRENLQFDAKPDQMQEAVPQQPIINFNEQPPSTDGFDIPPGQETDFEPSVPEVIEGPKVIDVNRNPVRRTPSTKPERKAPNFEREHKPPSFIEKLDTPTLDEPPDPGPIILEPEPGVVLPVTKNEFDPKYPDIAKKAEKEGEVLLHTTIDENGIPRDIVALTNLGFGLEEVAIEALKKTTYRPATKGGKPISLRVEISITFTLKDSD